MAESSAKRDPLSTIGTALIVAGIAAGGLSFWKWDTANTDDRFATATGLGEATHQGGMWLMAMIVCALLVVVGIAMNIAAGARSSSTCRRPGRSSTPGGGPPVHGGRR